VRAADLDLDLDVFAGPFDLLLTLVLREEVDLLEVDLADVVVTYIDWLEARGELDLELATEFLVLIAALLELKSRLMLPGEEQELLDLEPGEAAEELLARLLEAHRYRGAAEHLANRLADQSGFRFRSAPLPPQLRRSSLGEAGAVYDPAALGRALGGLLRMPPEISLAHVTIQRVTVVERLRHLRTLLRRGRFSFDEAVARADRVTVAVTIWALLELYKRGEATWEQDEPFADIQVEALAERPWPDLAGPATGAEPIRTPHVEPAAQDHHAVAADEPEADADHSVPLEVPA
jgi:segregation and condensation protein A